MADELNIPTHRWYQKRNHIALAKQDVSRQYIYDSGIQKIDAWINSQPWGPVLSLFANDEEGVWYDPSDLSTPFQDTAGTTPVTTAGQTVGLMLDKSQGLTLGPEEVTNGDFSDGATGWGVNNEDATHVVTFTDGKLRYQSDTTSPVLSFFQGDVLTAGVTYQVDVFVSSYTSGAIKSDQLGGAGFISKAGLNRIIFTSVGTGSLTFVRSTSDVDITIDNISVKELPGYHATQPTAAARPSYIVDTDGTFIQHDLIDDALTVTLPDMGTEATVAYVTRSEVRLLEDQTISGSYTLPTQEIAGFVAIDRALTIVEKVKLIQYLASKVEGVNYGAEIDRLTLIAINAVDVFVYDTSKDSDGGAWAENYPDQMVIVGESASVKIYDATDPDLPLHTTLDFTGYTVTSLAAVSGVLSVATSTGLATFNLADNDVTVALDYTASTTPAIVNSTVNDVAMTVLPDAPIDPATGLPVPTIAVATAGGVSVIKDDETVVDSGSTATYSSIFFSSDYYLYALDTTFADDVQAFGDVAGITADGFTAEAIYWEQTTNAVKLSDDIITNASEYPNGFVVAAQGVKPGLNTVYENRSSYTDGMVAYTTSTYNTGWMNGSIKGAFLSDTDDTDLVGGELVTNGTFDTDISGWTVTGTGVTATVVSGQVEANLAATAHSISQTLSVTPNTTYIYTWKARRGTIADLKVSVFNNTTFTDILPPFSYGATTTLQEYSLTFTTPTGCSAVRVYLVRDSGTTGTAFFDDASLRLADADRSVNNNGLIVNGTVTRSPVATGADLVAYSGFSASNYLEQPYNSDLDFGTGDFCVMGWVNIASGSFRSFFSRSLTGSQGGILVQIDNGPVKVFLSATTSYSLKLASTTAVNTGNWRFLAVKRSSGVLSISIDGQENASVADTTDVTYDNAVSRIGLRGDGFGEFTGSLALLRISATAPTAEQIAKIYNDEKVLFQENAQATLYGASDAVTALAHDPDTDLLHVGTSAGRSVFEGLRRVGNTTTSVSTSISASGGLIVEK